MSTKTIALESSVYERLAREKRESESFTKVISRLLTNAGQVHTGRSIVSALANVKPLQDNEAEQMLAVVEENRTGEKWSSDDLR
jgi:predicted CopG family antitoxin